MSALALLDRQPCEVPDCGRQGRQVAGKGSRCDIHRNTAVVVVLTQPSEAYGPQGAAWVQKTIDAAVYALRLGVPAEVLRESLAAAERQFSLT